MHRLLRWAMISGVIAATLLQTSASPVRAQDTADIAEGMRLFRQKGNCQSCHGWAGDGRKMDSQMPDGANLRESVLDRATLVLIIKCGRPGSGMPPFDKFAYSDGRCYGLKQADLKGPNRQMPDPPATLAAREVEAIADFMLAKVVGKGPMDRTKCIDYWGSDVEACKEFPK
jgi:Cytochrome C oxidase, cbb3-type, subunit III